MLPLMAAGTVFNLFTAHTKQKLFCLVDGST